MVLNDTDVESLYEGEEEGDFDFDSDEIITVISLVILFVIGTFGNSVVIVMYIKKDRRTSTDILIIAQAIVDLIASLSAPILLMRTAFASVVTNGVCVMAELSDNWTAFASLFIMMAISIDRFLIVCLPFRRRPTSRQSAQGLVATACSVAALAIMSPRAIFTRSVESDVHIEVNCDYQLGGVMLVVISVLFPVTFIVTMLITFALYIRIYVFLHFRAKVHARLVGKDHAGRSNGESQTCNDASQQIRETAAGSSIISSMSTSDPSHNKMITFTQQPSASRESGPCDLLQGSSDPPRASHQPDLQNVAPEPAESVAASSNSVPVEFDQEKKTQPQKSTARPAPRQADVGRSTTRMLLIITTYFSLTWFPNIILTLRFQQDVEELTTNDIAIVIGIFSFLRSTNHIVNIFVYYITNLRFRQAFQKLFTKGGLSGNVW